MSSRFRDEAVISRTKFPKCSPTFRMRTEANSCESISELDIDHWISADLSLSLSLSRSACKYRIRAYMHTYTCSLGALHSRTGKSLLRDIEQCKANMWLFIDSSYGVCDRYATVLHEYVTRHFP